MEKISGWFHSKETRVSEYSGILSRRIIMLGSAFNSLGFIQSSAKWRVELTSEALLVLRGCDPVFWVRDWEGMSIIHKAALNWSFSLFYDCPEPSMLVFSQVKQDIWTRHPHWLLSSRSDILWSCGSDPGSEMAFHLLVAHRQNVQSFLMYIREWMEDTKATKFVSLKNSYLKVPFLMIFKQSKDKHKNLSYLESCLSSVKITDFGAHEPPTFG